MLSLLLAGCKLKVFAGQGGSVFYGQSEAMPCEPSCVLDLSEATGESFIAQPDKGYAFSHWYGPTALCANDEDDETNACTVHQTTVADPSLAEVEVGLAAVFVSTASKTGVYEISDEDGAVTGRFIVTSQGRIVWTQTMVPVFNAYGYIVDTVTTGVIDEFGSFTLCVYGWSTAGGDDARFVGGHINSKGELNISQLPMNLAAMDAYFGPWEGRKVNRPMPDDIDASVVAYSFAFVEVPEWYYPEPLDCSNQLNPDATVLTSVVQPSGYSGE